MKNNKKLFLFLLFTISVFLFGCSNIKVYPSPSTPSINYSNNIVLIDTEVTTSTPFSTKDNTKYHIDGNTITINDTVSYVACANIIVEHNLSNGTLYLTEVNNGSMCKCLGCYNVLIHATIYPLPKRVILYGVKYDDNDNNIHIEPKVRLNVSLE